MTEQAKASCAGALTAALVVLVLLAAEGGAFGLLAVRYVSWASLERGWDALLNFTSMLPYANLVLLLVAGWFVFRLLGSAFNLFASLAEPEGGIGLVGYLAGLIGLALLAALAAAVALPERWMPQAEKWAEGIDPKGQGYESWLRFGVPYLPAYLLLVAGASLHSFRLMGDDRQRLRSGGGRLAESGMHWWEFLGGWPGSLLGMMVFRHKAASLVYLIGFVLAAGLHFAAVGGLLHLLKGGLPAVP